MAEAFVYDLMGQYLPGMSAQSGYAAADRLLDAPTNEAWIDPGASYLTGLGVRFVMGQKAVTLNVEGGRIADVTLQDIAGGGRSAIEADWFVCAMPVEQTVLLLSPAVLAADPALGGLRKLKTDWMNGIQYFLNRPPALAVKGHVAFLDTPWSLTAIDQGLFWKQSIRARYGDGRVSDIYSVDISDFFTPGIIYGRAAVDCTPDQIAQEVWVQMQRQLNTSRQTVLSDDMLVTWSLDPAITYPSGRGAPASNSEPLLINATGSLDDRPQACTAIPNLFLAPDYVRTNIDLATMEGANEAAGEPPTPFWWRRDPVAHRQRSPPCGSRPSSTLCSRSTGPATEPVSPTCSTPSQPARHSDARATAGLPAPPKRAATGEGENRWAGRKRAATVGAVTPVFFF